VDVTPASEILTLAETRQFRAVAKDGEGNTVAGQMFTWSSSDQRVAAVDGKGLVTAVGSGEATITAEANGVPGNAVVTVVVIASVSAGQLYTCALTTGGIAYCWGGNVYGQLGSGTATVRYTPVPIAGGLSFASLTAGTSHTCGVTIGGTAHCWGYNPGGQLGDGTTTNRYTPVPVANGLSFASLTAGNAHTCGLTTAGTAYCWGRNGSGQLGDGTTVDRTTPVPVANGLSFASLTAGGGHTCGLTTAGTAYCWGYNFAGQLGDGTTVDRTTPALVTRGLSFASLAAGYGHTCGVTTSGSAYCWGSNGEGQLADGTHVDRTTPEPVRGGLSFAPVIAGGLEHTCGVTTGGSAYCWGDNDHGQLGDGTDLDRFITPVPVAGGLSFASLTAGTGHTCGVTGAGSLYCWGDNGHGRLGDGTTTNRYIPVSVTW
jgi:alpha-tubulin suppressor-like RCC1 family protein